MSNVNVLNGIMEDVAKARHYIEDIINTPYLHNIEYPVDYLLAVVYNNLVSVQYILELQIEKASKKENE